jgi:hypothetical protein
VEVAVDVAVAVPVDVFVGVVVTARLRKTTIVCEAVFPSTMVTVTLLAVGSLLINRSAGIVYISATEKPDCESSVIVNDPAAKPMMPEQAPTGTLTDFFK